MDRHGVFYNRLWPPKLLGCRFAWEVGRLGPYIHTVFVRYAICIYIYIMYPFRMQGGNCIIFHKCGVSFGSVAPPADNPSDETPRTFRKGTSLFGP